MNIDSPKSSQAQEKGDLLYDLILSQQQDEEEIQNTLYQNQVLENFVGSNMAVSYTHLDVYKRQTRYSFW